MRRSLGARLGLLSALYLVQGLPAGFPFAVLLRRQDVSLQDIGLASLLGVPWMLKWMVAPYVEVHHVARLGRRRSWILPLQLALAALALAASQLDLETQLPLLLGLMLAMNVCSATMDVAVDGLAVDLLSERELGPGNAAQVIGFKLGMLFTGGLGLALTGVIGFAGIFGLIAAVTLAVMALTAAWREQEATERAPPSGVGEVLRALLAALRAPGAVWVLLFIGTYKLGEAACDAMFKPFLVDAGYGDDQIGLWVGTFGTLASLAGSLAGGLLAYRVPLVRAIGIAAVLRAGPMIGQWALAATGPTDAGVIAVTFTEHFFGGALTTAMFAFMMSRVDRRIGAAHFTVFATLELLGKLPAGAASGALTDAIGYAGTFALGAALSLAFLGLLVPIARAPRPGSPAA